MAKSFLVSPGRAYLVIAEEGTKIVRTNGTLIDTVPEGANSVSITVDSHEIIVMDNAAKIQQLYNGNSGSNGIMTTADGEDAGTWKIEIVSSLPEQGSAGIIYMLRTNRTGTDRYDDYIWIPEDNAYELLGRRPESTPVDLSNVAKTDVTNIFTKSQQINGTLTATAVNVANLSCDQEADIGTAVVNDLDYNTASGSSMTVSHVTILTSLHVAPQATVDLPDVAWRTDADGNYIDVTRKLYVDDVEVRDTARVGNVLTLGTGSIELDGQSSTIEVANADYSVVIAPASVRASSPDATLMLKGDEISMQTVEENRTVFSFAQSADGKFVLNVSDGATLDGTISMPGTLTVNNLNVTGTVTGITTGGGGGGGTTPTIDFSNGVTIMQVLTADDIVADTVAASTLSAESSLSVDSEQIIYRSSSDGAMYIQGDIVNATVVVAPTLMPTHIQGATFTGPLVVTQDNALQVLGPGGGTEIRNGNITTYTGKATTFSVMETLVVNDLVVTGTATDIARLEMEEGTARNVSVTDTLVAKDLIVTRTAHIQEVGGDFAVKGYVSTISVLTDRVRLAKKAAELAAYVTDDTSIMVTVTTSEVDSLVTFATDRITAWGSIKIYGDGALSATAEQVEWRNRNGRMVFNTDSLEMCKTFDDGGSDGYDDGGARLAVLPTRNYGLGSTQNVLLHGTITSSPVTTLPIPTVVMRVPSIQLGWIDNKAVRAADYPADPVTRAGSGMLALHNVELSSMCCLCHASAAGELELRAYVQPRATDTRPYGDWDSRVSTLRVSNLRTDSIRMGAFSTETSAVAVLSPLCVEQGLTVIGPLVTDGEITAPNSVIGDTLIASNLVIGDTLSTLTKDAEVQTTPTGTDDTLCRWAQIGSSHNMLSKGRLKYIDIPGPSVQKLPSSVGSASFVLSLWYQVDSAGADFQLIGSSTNKVTPAAGTTTSNRWYFNYVEIKDEHLGRNLRLLMLPNHGVLNSDNTWEYAVNESYARECYIQGRYSPVSGDNDCLLAASNDGTRLFGNILTAEFACAASTPGHLLTGAQMELLDWLAANKEALSNLISSASA